MSTTSTAARPRTAWSTSRHEYKNKEKWQIATHFVEHEFLVPDGASPEAARETVASIFVNQGTTQNIIVEKVLEWIKTKSNAPLFDITWYTTGSLVPATLRKSRQNSQGEDLELRQATQLFQFPGRVDPIREVVIGPEPVTFVKQLDRCFSYAFLGAYSFDIDTGKIYFHYSTEVELQVACAGLYAARKYLFLDSSKFKQEGVSGYDINLLLGSSENVTIYTESSNKDDWIKEKFSELCATLLETQGERRKNRSGRKNNLAIKNLRLCIVGLGNTPTYSEARSGLYCSVKKLELSAEERAQLVLRMLSREESAVQLARRAGVAEQTLYRWRDEFISAGKQAVNGRGANKAQAKELAQLGAQLAERERVIGEPIIANRLLKSSRAAQAK